MVSTSVITLEGILVLSFGLLAFYLLRISEKQFGLVNINSRLHRKKEKNSSV
jgi:hypothetical protein